MGTAFKVLSQGVKIRGKHLRVMMDGSGTTIRTQITVFPFREMDVEVSEPIDFSHGDHQHLVHKAADTSTPPKPQQAKAAPPPGEAKQTQGKPHPKTDQRADAYVVQISEETTPEESIIAINPFSEESIRKREHEGVFSLGEKSKCPLKMFPQKYGILLLVFFFFPARLFHETWGRAAVDRPSPKLSRTFRKS